MKVQTMAVVPKITECNLNCKFCIKKSTFTIKEAEDLDYNKLRASIDYALKGGAQTVSISGGGEPLVYGVEKTEKLIKFLKRYFGKIDIHTNGTFLDDYSVKRYANAGLTNAMISRAHYDEEINKEIMGGYTLAEEKVKILNKNEIVPRLSVILLKGYVDDGKEIKKYLDWAAEIEAKQVIIRQLSVIPEKYCSYAAKENEWSKQHFISISIAKDFLEKSESEKLLTLPWGPPVYSYRAENNNFLNVCTYTYPENEEKGYSLRSVLFFPDNHLYYSWKHQASLIM